jgi:hypothetical protein
MFDSNLIQNIFFYQTGGSTLLFSVGEGRARAWLVSDRAACTFDVFMPCAPAVCSDPPCQLLS